MDMVVGIIDNTNEISSIYVVCFIYFNDTTIVAFLLSSIQSVQRFEAHLQRNIDFFVFSYTSPTCTRSCMWHELQYFGILFLGY